MIRKYNNNTIEIVKKMMVSGYSNVVIKETMFLRHKIEITSSTLQQIKSVSSYSDVCSHLNKNIKCLPKFKYYLDKELIEEIKWSISNDYTDEEIIRVFKISRKRLTSIKMGYAPFFSVAPQYNSVIQEKHPRKKRNNVDRNMIIKIKKEYVDNYGDISLISIAEKLGTSDSVVSRILNLKIYSTIGSSFNSKILSIKKKKEKLKQQKILNEKRKIEERNKLSKLREQKKMIIDKIKEQENRIKIYK